MKLNVIKTQNISDDCLVCGTKNPASLKSKFYELEGEIIVSVLNAEQIHQSFPGRMHGGVIGAALDETIGRAIMIKDPLRWGVTGELTVRYLKPTPLDTQLFVYGKIVTDRGKIFKGVGYMEANGEVVATATATYFSLPINAISGDIELDKFWHTDHEIAPKFFETANIELLDKLALK